MTDAKNHMDVKDVIHDEKDETKNSSPEPEMGGRRESVAMNIIENPLTVSTSARLGSRQAYVRPAIDTANQCQ